MKILQARAAQAGVAMLLVLLVLAALVAWRNVRGKEPVAAHVPTLPARSCAC